ncbi:MAG: indolepyruvate oxidoreductase subunit beta family protein [Burkholderiaceae bacterium]
MTTQPFSILVAAIGGEGGGVLADWLVDGAMRAGLPVQATSVPGVAQRTGATSYYFECLREPVADGKRPVFALMPVPGRVDVLLASELLEAGRMIERGFVNPQRTLLITARHRVLTTAEKMQMADGRYDDERLHEAGRKLSRQYLSLDLRAIAERNRTVISAVMFGALAGSGVLPWSRELCEESIRAGGVGVDTSLAGFAAAFIEAAAATTGGATRVGSAVDVTTAGRSTADRPTADGPTTNRAATDRPTADRPAADRPTAVVLPAGLEAIVALGHARALDFQDADYAGRYRSRIDALVASAGAGAGVEAGPALVEAARQLALWMTYEDVIRVADLKTRRERYARIRSEASAGVDDVVEIREHFSPKLAELAAIAPAPIGRMLRAHAGEHFPVGSRGKGRTLVSNAIAGFAILKLLAAMKRWRPRSLRFVEEQEAIEAWLGALRVALPAHVGYARALAGLPRLRKGYSDTWTRGVANYDRIFATLVAPVAARGTAPGDDDASTLQAAIDAALADPAAVALDRALAAHEIRRPGAGATAGVGDGRDRTGTALARPIHFRPPVRDAAGGGALTRPDEGGTLTRPDERGARTRPDERVR